MATFWLVLLLACVAWYSSVTLYVAWRGLADIRTMLDHLRQERADSQTPPTHSPG